MKSPLLFSKLFTDASAALFLTFALLPQVFAHSPHDVVKSVALSPRYDADQAVFIYVHDELKRSLDGGHTWKTLENGLDLDGLVQDIAIAPDRNDEYSVFLGTENDGVFRSTDRGNSWMAVNSGLSKPEISSLAISPKYDTDHTLAAITGDGGLFISTDGANSWRQLQSAHFTTTTATFVAHQDSLRLLVGTANGGIFVSDSPFDNWLKQSEYPGVGRITALSSPRTTEFSTEFYIATELRGLLKTGDFGKTSQPVHLTTQRATAESNAGSSNLRVSSIVIRPVKPGQTDIFVATSTETVFVSKDDGATWTELATGLKKYEQATNRNEPHFYEIAASPTYRTDGVLFAAGFGGLFKTNDGGRTWREMETRPARNIEGLAVLPLGSGDHLVALATYDAGVSVSSDSGETWVARNAGLDTAHLWGTAIAKGTDTNPIIYAISNRSFSRSPGLPPTWSADDIAASPYWTLMANNFDEDTLVHKLARRILKRPDMTFPTQIALSPNLADDGTMFLGTRHKGVLKTVDRGATWENTWDAEKGWILSIEVSPNFARDQIVAASIRERGFYLSSDGGHTWTAMNNGLSSHAIKYEYGDTSMLVFSPDFARDKTLYFGTGDGLYRSTNGARTWDKLTVVQDKSRINVKTVAPSPNYGQDGLVLASIKGLGLYRSTNKGASFSPLANELIENNETLKLIRYSPDFAENRTIFSASAEEAYVSRDAGATWKKLERPVMHENTSDNFVYSGNWSIEKNRSFSTQNAHQSNVRGAKAEFHFFGEQATWYGPKSPAHGMANVYIDGALATKVDQYHDSPVDFAEVFSAKGLRRGPHVFTIEVLGTGNENADDSKVAVDAVDVL